MHNEHLLTDALLAPGHLGEQKDFEVYSCHVSPDGSRLATAAGGMEYAISVRNCAKYGSGQMVTSGFGRQRLSSRQAMRVIQNHDSYAI